MLTVIGLFLAFGVVSVGFWAYFRYRKPRATTGGSDPEPEPEPSGGFAPGTEPGAAAAPVAE
jgi:hypothetical protein